MNITGGHTIEVFRHVKDRFGDRSEQSVGTIDHCVFQWASTTHSGLHFKASGGFQETSDVTALFYVPRHTEPKIQDRDRIVFKGKTFRVVGLPAWDEEHPATGHDFGYYLVQVEASA